MSANECFKAIARTSRRPSRKEMQLPIIKRSCSPSTLTTPTNSHSSLPKASYRSSSTDRLTLPDLRSSRNGSSSSGRNETGKSSDKPCGVVKAYAASSRKTRSRNEDRVSIIINIPHPAHIDESIWPQSSFYSLYSGHSGKFCSDYLKSNLSSLIFSSPEFPRNTKKALFSSFVQADQDFLKLAKEQGNISGSCALVVLMIGDKCFVANTGDTRAIISIGQGKAVTAISADHKPSETSEYNRIIQAGGKVSSDKILNDRKENINIGPLFVQPGKLKFSRSFGDIDAKDTDFCGNPNVVIPDPHIKSFPIKPEQDFIFVGTGSIFERMGSREICEIVFKNARLYSKKGLGIVLSTSVEEILSETVDRGCSENATAIIIALKGLKNIKGEYEE